LDPASIAAALIGARSGEMQFAVAAKMLKMNAEQGTSIAQLVAAGEQNASGLASLAAGLGRHLDVTA
jgi:hypothetical protein